MRINNNIPALNTHRLLNMNTNKLQGALERLSSGKRINRASDDAAGMAISQKMQAQVRGLQQASRNSLDGISLIQTAEGALNEVHEILQRMRELSVQASNGTNAKEDLVAIQNEINELTEEVDRIANTTEFNKISLLNRNNISEEDLEVITSQLKKWWLIEAETLVEQGYGIKANNIDMEITFSNNPNDSAAAFVSGKYILDGNGQITGKGSDLVLNINLAHSQPINPENTNGGTPPQYVDRVIAHEMVHAIMASTMNFGSLPKWFKEGSAEFIHGADERLVGNIHRQGGGISSDEERNKGIMAIVSSIDKLKDKSGSITPLEYSTSYVLTRYLDKQIREVNLNNSGAGEDSRGIKAIMEYLALEINQEKTLGHAIEELNKTDKLGFSTVDGLIEAFKADVKDYASLEEHTGIKLDFIMENGYAVETDTGSIMGSSILGPGKDKNAENILPQDEVIDEENLPGGFKLTWAKDVIQQPIKLQIGSNEGQYIEITLSDMRAKALGIIEDGKSLDVTDNERAAEAITKFEKAIGIVSMERSKLGSYQNRLEHTIRNLDNTAENLQSAESRIADADMAIEMSIFTKLNILQQAGTSMLSQANNLPQSVLQLLK